VVSPRVLVDEGIESDVRSDRLSRARDELVRLYREAGCCKQVDYPFGV